MRRRSRASLLDLTPGAPPVGPRCGGARVNLSPRSAPSRPWAHLPSPGVPSSNGPLWSYSRRLFYCTPFRLICTSSRFARGTSSRFARGTSSRVVRGTSSRVVRGTASRANGRFPVCQFHWELQRSKEVCQTQMREQPPFTTGCTNEWDNISCWQHADVGDVLNQTCPSALFMLFGKNGAEPLLLPASHQERRISL
ncbi:hypothetical protein CRUP_010690 [Coryphaenoides rupestris]|nr:hypothetical protein CRUP_010690 [Coryphaenoides rupestris]